MNEDQEICEACENVFPIDYVRMDDEDGNWFCEDCITQMAQDEINS